MMLRIMLDTMVHDFRSLIDRAIEQCCIELVRTSVQKTQLLGIKDTVKRSAALSIPGRQVATYGFIPGWAVPGEARPADCGDKVRLGAIQKGNPRHAPDALIGATAEMEADVLVTDDKRLTRRIQESGSCSQVWKSEDFEKYMKTL
jgi:hypothetical protein